MIFRRSPDVPALDDYTLYRPFLRRDFEFRCAYCLRHEFFFGGGEAGEIDHFRPRHLFPALVNPYPNRSWCCRKCNAVKGGTWPAEAQAERGLRFLDPCADDQNDHWQAHADGTLTASTLPGRYTIRHLRLDRPTLVEFRRFLLALQARAKAIEAALAEADLPPVLRAALQAELASAAALLYPPVFSL